MKLIAVTVGFDEKLPIRSLLRVGIDVGDVVLLIYSKTGGEFEVKKVESAVKVLKEILSKSGVKVVDVVVSGMDFYRDIEEILKVFGEHPAEEIVALLVGGMRLTIFEVLVAALLRHRISGVSTRFHLMREDGMYEVSIPVEVFNVLPPPKAGVALKVLSVTGAMERRELVEAIARGTGVSESMAYKLIKSLAERSLVVVKGDVVRLTELGRLVYEATKRGDEVEDLRARLEAPSKKLLTEGVKDRREASQ